MSGLLGSAIRPILFLLDKDRRYSNTPLSDPYITTKRDRQREGDRGAVQTLHGKTKQATVGTNTL